MAAKKAAKRTPWDNISQWEHQNSFIRQSEEYKKVSWKNISLGCMGTPSSYQTNMCTPFLKYFLQTYYYNNIYHDHNKYDYIPFKLCNVPDLYKSLLKIWRSFDKERILEDMSVADILSELVYKDERVGKLKSIMQNARKK